MRFCIKNKESVSFKKRYKIGYKKIQLLFGNFSFTLCKSFKIEYIYLYNFKKSLKKYFKFKKGPKKVWLFLHKNYPLTKKSKNSRMGKGKGAVARYCSRVLQNHNLFEFYGFNIKELFFLKKNLKKKVFIPIRINTDFFQLKKSHFYSKSETFFLTRKYNT